MQIKIAVLLVVIFSSVLLSGCNFLSGLHRDGVESNTTVLVADGQAALARGDYFHAKEYFRLAIEHDLKDSEARVGYAEAFLKDSGFDMVAVAKTLMDSSNNSNQAELVKPADWGCANYTELTELLSTVIYVLDPITQGWTQGPFARNDFGVNFNVGLFYVFRMSSRVKEYSAIYQVGELSKSGQTAAGLGITQTEFDLLPDNFYWVVDNLGNPAPTGPYMAAVQDDVDQGIARLRTAASVSKQKETMNDLIDKFQSLQVQLTP